MQALTLFNTLDPLTAEGPDKSPVSRNCRHTRITSSLDLATAAANSRTLLRPSHNLQTADAAAFKWQRIPVAEFTSSISPSSSSQTTSFDRFHLVAMVFLSPFLHSLPIY